MESLSCFLCVLVNIVALSHCVAANIPCEPCYCNTTEKGVTADCTNKRLTHIPGNIPKSTSILKLTSNSLVDLPHRSFSNLKQLKILDLSYNKISSMSVNAFRGLHNLETLSLHTNNLTLQDTTYPYGLFRDLGHLMTLDLSKNDNRRSINASYPDMALSHLLSLKNLLMDGLENATLGKGFSSLRHLTNLTLSGYRGYCSICQLLNDSFINVPLLQYLNISKCQIEVVSRFAFEPMNNMDILDISDNTYLGIDKLGESLYGLRHSKIRVLRANRVERTFAIGVNIQSSHFQYLNNTELKELYVDYNRIELIDSFIPVILRQLEVLSMRCNRITFGLYVFSLSPMVNLKIVDASGQYQSNNLPFNSKGWGTYGSVWQSVLQGRAIHTPDVSRDNPIASLTGDHEHDLQRLMDILRNNERRVLSTRSNRFIRSLVETYGDPKYQIPIPPKLIVFNTSHCKMSYVLYHLRFTQNNVKILDMSHNLFTKWIGPFHPLDKLEKWFLSNNYCTEIGPLFFSYANNLKLLDMSNNNLADPLRNDSEGVILKNQEHLETLNISNNFIKELPKGIFKYLKNLQQLDLSWNIMHRWDVNIKHMLSLRCISLSYNRFESLPRKLRQEIDMIMTGQNDTFRIKVNGNILKCNCLTLESLQWTLKSYLIIEDEYDSRCCLDDGTTMTLDQRESIVLDLQKKCKTPLPVIFGTLSGIVLFLVVLVGGIVYRYRWKLRYLYYTTKRKYRGYQRLTEDDNFRYDAFVSYADEDRDFVVNKMRFRLEEKFGLKLCIHHRDFLVGEAITANIISAVQSSRKTIAVLSPNFVKSSWCDYEVHMAKLESIHTGRDVLCIVWYNDVPTARDIAEDLLEEIATGTYIKYTDDMDGEELFWASLRDAIKH